MKNSEFMKVQLHKGAIDIQINNFYITAVLNCCISYCLQSFSRVTEVLSDRRLVSLIPYMLMQTDRV